MPTSKALHFSVTAEAATEGEAAVTISTDSPDRSRDRVMPGGADLTAFMKNPVVLFGHDYHSIPVGTATSIQTTEHGLTATWKWLTGDPFADRVKNAWDQGVLRAASIGFKPTKDTFDEERRGFDYLEWELLEFSIVAVPANAEAVRTMKELGLPIDPAVEELAEVKETVAYLEAMLDDGYEDEDELDDDDLDEDAVIELMNDEEDERDWVAEIEDSDPATIDFDGNELRDAATGVIQDNWKDIVGAAVVRAVNRAKGRVD